MSALLTLREKQTLSIRRDAAACLLLVGLNGLWLMCLTMPFFCADDSFFVRDNVYVTGGLSWRSISWAFTTTFPDYWHPLTWISLALDGSLVGTQPWGYHLTNVAIHTANGLLVYAFVRRAFGGVGRSLAAASLFAIHPQRVEAVAWISERKEVLAAFFALLALLAYLRFVRCRGAAGYLLVCLLFVCSLLAKPVLAFPCLLLLIDYWPLRRFGSERFWPILKEKIPLLLLALAGAMNTYMSVLASSSIRSDPVTSLKQAVVNYALYLRDTFYFGRLCFFSRAREPDGWQVAEAGMVLAGISAAMLFVAWRRPRFRGPLFVGWLWFLIAMAPASGILQAGYSMYGDRFTYIPALGLIVALVFGIAPAMGLSRNKAWNFASVSVVVVVLSAFTVRRLWLWRDPLALCQHDLAIDPGNAYLEYDAGVAAKERHLNALAMEHFQRAAELDPKEFAFDRAAMTRPKAGLQVGRQ